MENLIVILIAGGVAFVLAFVVALFCSNSVRQHGLFGAIRREVSRTEEIRHPYRG